jgi:hypothetical protein
MRNWTNPNREYHTRLNLRANLSRKTVDHAKDAQCCAWLQPPAAPSGLVVRAQIHLPVGVRPPHPECRGVDERDRSAGIGGAVAGCERWASEVHRGRGEGCRARLLLAGNPPLIRNISTGPPRPNLVFLQLLAAQQFTEENARWRKPILTAQRTRGRLRSDWLFGAAGRL